MGVGSSGSSDSTSGGGCGSCWKGQSATPLPPLQWGWVVVVVLIVPVVVGVMVVGRGRQLPPTTTAVGVDSSGFSDNTSGGGCGSCWKGQTATPYHHCSGGG